MERVERRILLGGSMDAIGMEERLSEAWAESKGKILDSGGHRHRTRGCPNRSDEGLMDTLLVRDRFRRCAA